MKTACFEKLAVELTANLGPARQTNIRNLIDRLEQASIARDSYVVNEVMSAIIGGMIARVLLPFVASTSMINSLLNRTAGFCFGRVIGGDINIGERYITSSLTSRLSQASEAIKTKCEHATSRGGQNTIESVLENELATVVRQHRNNENYITLALGGITFIAFAFTDQQALVNWVEHYIPLPRVGTQAIIDCLSYMLGFAAGVVVQDFRAAAAEAEQAAVTRPGR